MEINYHNLHAAIATILKLLTLANSSADCWRSGVLKAYDPTVATTSVMLPTLSRTFFWRSAAFCSDALWMSQRLITNDITWSQNLPTFPIMDTNLSSAGFPSLARTFFADSSDLNTPTTLIPAASILILIVIINVNFEEKTAELLNIYTFLKGSLDESLSNYPWGSKHDNCLRHDGVSGTVQCRCADKNISLLKSSQCEQDVYSVFYIKTKLRLQLHGVYTCLGFAVVYDADVYTFLIVAWLILLLIWLSVNNQCTDKGARRHALASNGALQED